jgi:flagellin-like protein
MKMQFGKKRKAVSPVLATVILIAITLIAAIAIAGFVFGLFGSFTSTAQVQAQVVTCTAATEVCTLSLLNTGTGNTAATGCSISVSGKSQASTLTTQPQTLTAGAAAVANIALRTWRCGPSSTPSRLTSNRVDNPQQWRLGTVLRNLDLSKTAMTSGAQPETACALPLLSTSRNKVSTCLGFCLASKPVVLA